MKTLCNKLMSLDVGEINRKDYGQIAFLFFILDKNLINKKIVEINEYYTYLFRFYCDNLELSKIHYNKIIKNINICKPRDLKNNALENLLIIKNRTGLIDYDETNIYWKDTENNVDYSILIKVIMFVASKYTNIKNFNYTEKLEKKDFNDINNIVFGNKLFNRLLERFDSCYMCDENMANDLVVVPISLDENDLLDVNNYILLCTSHSKMYCNGKMQILDNGTTYINGKKENNRLDIYNFKKIRKYIRKVNNQQ